MHNPLRALARHGGHSRVARRRLSGLAVLAMVGTSLGAIATTTVGWQAVADAGTPPPAPSGWTTVFSDSFNGAAGTAPSSANWFHDTGTGFGTGEIEQMTTSTANCALDGNGDLKFTAIDTNGTWTSCRLESQQIFQDPAGGQFEMEASVEQPNPPSGHGLGYWPAFWALGGNLRKGVSWPTSGELDMMEDVNALNEASQTLHDSSGGPGHPLIACPTVGCQNGFNTYAVIINRVNTSAEYLQFLMDGVVEDTITEASVGTTAWQNAIDNGWFIMWDLAMGGNYPNGVCGCTTPTSATASGYSMLANWVAVYSTSGGGGGTTTTPTTTPTTVPGSNCSAGVSGTALSRSGWAVSTNTAAAGGDVDTNAIDGNLSTRFSSDAAQAPGMYWQANLGSAKSFDELQMQVPNSNGDYARGYEVQVSNDGNSWTTVASCTGTGDPEVVSFPTQTAQYVRVTLTASYSASWWSIDELNLYASSSTTTTTTPPTTTTSPTTTTGGGGSGANCSASVAGTELSQSGWSASTNAPSGTNDAPANAIDGNLSTRFSTDRGQTPGDYLQVNLGSAKTFDHLELSVPNSNGDYARGYTVSVSSNASTWTTLATCTGSGTPEVVSFPSQTAQYVRVTLTTSYSASWWSVDELDLFSSSSGGGGSVNCSASVSGTALSQSGWTASSNTNPVANDAPSNAIDGNLSTRFSSDADQASGQTLTVNMGSAKTFSELDLQVPNSTGDYARGYEVQVSSNGSSWTTVASCTGTGQPEVVSFPSQTAQYVQVVLTAGSTTNWWSVDELDLY